MVTEKKYYTQTDTQSINNINECWAVTTNNTSCLWCDKKMKAISRIKPKKIEKKDLLRDLILHLQVPLVPRLF